MKTIHLTLTGLTISEVLKQLQENDLAPGYLGTDQDFNLLFLVSYAEEKEAVIQNILNHINSYKKLDYDIDVALDLLFSELAIAAKTQATLKKPIKKALSRGAERFIKKLEHEIPEFALNTNKDRPDITSDCQKAIKSKHENNEQQNS